MNLTQRIFVLRKCIQGKKYCKIKAGYESEFGVPCPTHKAVVSLVRKFERTGSLLNAKKAGRPKNTRLSVDRVREIVLANPRVSLRTHENQLSYPRSTLHRVIKKDFKLKSYCFQVLHHLYEWDFSVRARMCTQLLGAAEDLKSSVLFSDEAIFHFCGKVNRRLVPGSLEVYPIHDYGAVLIGYHQFFNHAEPANGWSKPDKYIAIWRNQGGKWQLTRVVSLH